MSHWVVREGWYEGSLLLEPISSAVGTQVDKFNYIVAGFGSILIGAFYRIYLHPSRVSPSIRKIFTLITGVLIVYFCFGAGIKHMLLQTFFSYLLLQFCPVEPLPRATLFLTLGYQSILHAFRMYHDFEGYTLDITGALMMLTQRLTSLAFSLRDGQMPEKSTPFTAADAIRTKPDVLTYFSYAFDFHMILCGPLIPFNEFLAVTEGTIFDERTQYFKQKKGINVVDDPSPTPFVLKRALYALISILVILFVVPHFPISYLFTDEFYAQNVFKKVFSIVFYTALTRQQYYVIWKMAEAVCNSSNFGYRFRDGEDHWDGCTNIEIWGVESAKSQRDGLAAWNVSTQRWLRSICYERLKSNKTMMTFFLSAAWHGFYPGYYLTFMTLAVQTMAARTARRCIRHHFQGTATMRLLYDTITRFTVMLGFAYSNIAFVLLTFGKSFSIWSQVYFYGHVFCLFMIFVLPKILPPSKTKDTDTTLNSLSTNSNSSKKQG